MCKEFPIDVFEDVKATEFEKHNKKHVTEDFVTENLKEIGWRVYRPFNDTGIDLIATKLVCPNGHTLWNKEEDEKCHICGNYAIEIMRFIQVKTREVKGSAKNQYFGYTLSAKDFRTDPRHVFVLYSDFTGDFIIIPTYEYMKIFTENKEMGKSHFGTPAFRVGNNKQNGLKYNNKNKEWAFNPNKENINCSKYLNKCGIKLMSNPKYDLNFAKYVEEISEMKFKLFFTFSKGKQFNEEQEKYINSKIAENVLYNKENIAQKRKNNRRILKNKLSQELINSIEKGYFVKFKGVSFYE